MEENIAHAEEGVAVAASEEEVPIAATKPVTNSATGPTVDDPIDTPNGLSTPERTLLSSSSIQSIKLKLLTQGLTDEVSFHLHTPPPARDPPQTYAAYIHDTTIAVVDRK